ncbi:MAG: HAMP domain-containing histidine kinase [Lachnospiraceae bacterium]|nr:HAMP domain-containing histidine kinase [Lachnospiraceae bacterium]MDE6964429.1 HAMP domain-containing histidine kinase [Lachnospiraceae bacterium]
MKTWQFRIICSFLAIASAGLAAALIWMLWEYIPKASTRYGILAVCAGIFLAAGFWCALQRYQIEKFADDVCETIDAAMADRRPQNFHPYEDSLTAKVQGKLLQYYDIMHEGRLQSRQDKETLQSLVSDISHQVKTPVANMKLYTGILHRPGIPEEKRELFLNTMDAQIGKLDFLMQSLIKMSRLETGTFALNPVLARLNDTIAQAMNTVWAKAEQKNIELSAQCGADIMVRHDIKWTAEAMGNILDNAIKYTPEGGRVSVTVCPWQFYTRIDISDTGIGIPKEHYNDVFQRFYRAEEVAAEEGVGLGLYLANGIVTRQKGYISVKSKVGEGTTFSVYLLS